MVQRHWRELLPGRESTFEKHERFAELSGTDPYPQNGRSTAAFGLQ